MVIAFDQCIHKDWALNKISPVEAAHLVDERDAKKFILRVVERDSEGQDHLVTIIVSGAKLSELLLVTLDADKIRMCPRWKNMVRVEIVDIAAVDTPRYKPQVQMV